MWQACDIVLSRSLSTPSWWWRGGTQSSDYLSLVTHGCRSQEVNSRSLALVLKLQLVSYVCKPSLGTAMWSWTQAYDESNLQGIWASWFYYLFIYYFSYIMVAIRPEMGNRSYSTFSWRRILSHFQEYSFMPLGIRLKIAACNTQWWLQVPRSSIPWKPPLIRNLFTHWMVAKQWTTLIAFSVAAIILFSPLDTI